MKANLIFRICQVMLTLALKKFDWNNIPEPDNPTKSFALDTKAIGIALVFESMEDMKSELPGIDGLSVEIIPVWHVELPDEEQKD